MLISFADGYRHTVSCKSDMVHDWRAGQQHSRLYREPWRVHGQSELTLCHWKGSMIERRMPSAWIALMVVLLTTTGTFATDTPAFSVGEREIVATKSQRDDLGLKWFHDGNLGMVQTGTEVQLYGANGQSPVRVTGTMGQPLQKVEPVTIETANKGLQYLAGGPLYRDPESGRIFLFYHAEFHRGTYKNFYSLLGLAVQSDADGLTFNDLGPIFTANVSNENAKGIVEVCGAPYVIQGGYFYIYSRDVMGGVLPTQINLSVARARIADVVRAGLEGNSAEWQKFYEGTFSEPALGGRSTALEKGNPSVRWMDVSYNTILKRYIMIVAANTAPRQVQLFITWSDDGITWAERQKLVDDDGECFYPSILGFGQDQRQTGSEFYVYYTFSAKGGFERWNDAVIARRKITVSRR